MTPDHLKSQSREFLQEVWNAKNPDAVDHFVTPGFRQDRALPGVSPDREGLKEWVRTTLRAFPDIHFTVDEQVADGPTVVTRWTARGTHQDTFLGIPASGTPVTVEGITVSRFDGGRVREQYVQWDALGMMQQLGVAPSVGEGAYAENDF